MVRSSSNAEDLAESCARCSEVGVVARSYLADVANEDSVVGALDQVTADFGRLDGLINNAGIVRDALLVKVKDGQVVRVFNQRLEQIALHVQQEPGRFSTHAQHLAAAKISGIERGATWLLTKVGHIGPQTRQWAQAMLAARGIAGVRVLQGLIGLAKRHASAALEQACGTAFSYGAYRLRTLRTLLERQAPAQALLPFLQEHDLIRPLAEYGELVHKAFTKEREA